MKNLVAFFEIPAVNFNRAVDFYERVWQMKLAIMDCETEKMAFFPEENGLHPGAISFSDGFKPAEGGVLISLHVSDMANTLLAVNKNGGKTIRNKTKIEAEGRGYFSIIADSEGNHIGLYSDQ